MNPVGSDPAVNGAGPSAGTRRRGFIKLLFVAIAIYLPLQFAAVYLLGEEPWPVIVQPGFGWIHAADSTDVVETSLLLTFSDASSVEVDAGELLGITALGPKKTNRMVFMHFRPGHYKPDEWTPWLRNRLGRLYPDKDVLQLTVARKRTRLYRDGAVTATVLPAPEPLIVDLRGVDG